jgi:glutathione synthase/RimK-type ligase-like ATP-grasp enzyme
MKARHLAYLTMENAEGWSIDTELSFPPLMTLGWTINVLPWRSDNVDWDQYDAVYIGTPWDYPEDPDHFMRMLESIDRSSAILVNDIALVHWTMPKTYLRDLEERGAPIVRSIWSDDLGIDQLVDTFDRFGVNRVIVKPVISTNATDTYLLERDTVSVLSTELHETFANRPHIVQPFIENIQSEGEFSLFYFNRQFSHAIQKIPKRNDFRVQEEYGATISAVDPEAALRKTADQVMQVVDPLPVYARADFVRGPDGRFLLMELELIEPSLYLRMDEEAPWRFAEAFHDYVTKMSGSK